MFFVFLFFQFFAGLVVLTTGVAFIDSPDNVQMTLGVLFTITGLVHLGFVVVSINNLMRD
jgi:hypothetical protein